MGQLDGRVAIVTGGGEGLGRGIALRMAQAGAKVVIANRKQSTGDEVVSEIRQRFGAEADFIQTDVGIKDQVLRMVDFTKDRFGNVDILVNNAFAGLNVVHLEDRPDEDFDFGFRVGFMSAWWAMKAAFPMMRDQRWGRIINICSLNGVNAHLYTAEYNTAKEALRSLTRSAAREWARFQITANAICPAAVSTNFKKYAEASPENAALVAAQNPMGRMGDPEADHGGVAVFLASDDARYTTGNTLFVDGGAHINGVQYDPMPE